MPVLSERSPDLVGRGAECRRLDELVDRARGGSAGVVVVTGEAGIGKSVLLARAASRARDAGLLVLAASGLEAEADTPYATLHELLGPVFDRLDALSPVHAAWLRGALGLDVPADPPPTELGVFHATMSLLTSLAQEKPVALVVDDAQWVDSASLMALLFMLRRFDADPVAGVLACRSGTAPSQLARAGFEELALGPLSHDDAVQLLAGPDGLAPAVARRCRDLVAGNPQALLDGARALSAGQRAGTSPLPDALPVGELLAREIAHRLERLPERTVRALEVAAVDRSADVTVVAAALRHLGGSAADLTPAEDAGIVVVDEGTIAWADPLVRAAARDRASPADRRRIRGALVAAAPGRVDPDVLVQHLADSVDGPDEDVARRLEDSAVRLVRRAALDAAAAVFERAARLSPAPREMTRRILLAAGSRLWAGRTLESLATLEPLVAEFDDPELAASLALAVGAIETWVVSPAVGIHRMSVALSTLGPRHPRVASKLWQQIALGHLLEADGPAAVDAAAQAVDRASAAVDLQAIFAANTIARAARDLTGAGGAADDGPGLGSGELADMLIDAHSAGWDGTEMLTLLCAQAEMVCDECDRGLAHAEQVVLLSERAGALAWAMWGRVSQAEALWRLGRWTEALAELDQALSLDGAVGGDAIVFIARAAVARIEAGVGSFDASRDHARQVIEAVEGRRLRWILASAWAAVGLAELGAGRYDEAADCYARVAGEARGIFQPGLLRWQADAVEALHAAGRSAEAEAVLDELEVQAAATSGRWALGAASRCRALLGRSPAGGFDAAVDGFTAIAAPFELGRTLLMRGTAHLVAGDRAAAARDLAAARSIFDRLGARPWSDRVARASGDAHAHPGSLATILSPAELRVAVAVASGATNRQAADALYVSAKTVDFHLRAIFRKLGLRSRSELAARVATERPAAGGHREPGA